LALNKALLFGPIVAVASYLLIGVCTAAFGPLQYEGFRPALVGRYIASVVAFIIVGYLLGIKSRLPIRLGRRNGQNQAILPAVFQTSLIASLIMMTYLILSMLVSGEITLSMESSAAAYFNTYANYTRNSGNYSVHFLVSSIGALPLFIAQVLGYFYFERLGRFSRIAVIYLFLSTVLVYTLGGGKMKQFGDILVYVVSVIIAKQAAMGNLRLKVVLKIGMVLLVGAGVLLAVLSFRYQTIGVDLVGLNDKLHPLIHYRDGFWFEGALGEALAFPVVMLTGYLSQGYFGLSLSLEQPFTWTYFAGSSYSISVIMNQLFGLEFWVAQSYPYLVGDVAGWGQTKWHTVFAWLASDLTFTGVVFFMGLLGFVYGRVWRAILLYQNPFSILMFGMMNIGWIYAPANNQLMHTPGGLATTLGTIFLYLLFHPNFNTTSFVRR